MLERNTYTALWKIENNLEKLREIKIFDAFNRIFLEMKTVENIISKSIISGLF